MPNNNRKNSGGCLAVVLILLVLIGLVVWGTLSISEAFEVRNLKLDMKEAKEKAFEEYYDAGGKTSIEETESGREYLRLREELIERGEIDPESEMLVYPAINKPDNDMLSGWNDSAPEQNDMPVHEPEADDSAEKDGLSSLLDHLIGKEGASDNRQENSGHTSAGNSGSSGSASKPEKEQEEDNDRVDTSGLTAEQLETMEHIEEWLAGYYSDTEFYTCSFRFKQLGMNDRYVYEIHRKSDLLEETFYVICLRSKVGSKWRVAGSVVRNVSSLPHTYDWDLDGTWTYRDSGNDYTLTVKDVHLDPATKNSELQEFNMTVSYQLTGDGEPLAIAENEQVTLRVYYDNVSNGDFNDWYLSGSQGGHSVWLHPMGGESTISGSGIGFNVNGYWLSR